MSKFTSEDLMLMPDPVPRSFCGKRTVVHASYLNIFYRATSNQAKYENKSTDCTICNRWKDSYENFAEDVMSLEHYKEWRNGEGGYKLCLKPGCTEYSLENVHLVQGGTGSIYRVEIDYNKIYTHPKFGEYRIINSYDTYDDNGKISKRCDIQFLNTGTIAHNISYYHCTNGEVRDPYARIMKYGVCTGNASSKQFSKEFSLFNKIAATVADPNSFYGSRGTQLSPEFYCFEYFLKMLPYLPNYSAWYNSDNPKGWILAADISKINMFTPYNVSFIPRQHIMVAQNNPVGFQQKYMYRNPVTDTLFNKVNEGTELCRIVDKDKK